MEERRHRDLIWTCKPTEDVILLALRGGPPVAHLKGRLSVFPEEGLGPWPPQVRRWDDPPPLAALLSLRLGCLACGEVFLSFFQGQPRPLAASERNRD